MISKSNLGKCRLEGIQEEGKKHIGLFDLLNSLVPRDH